MLIRMTCKEDQFFTAQAGEASSISEIIKFSFLA